MLRRVVITLFLAGIVTGTALADGQLGGVARQLSMGGGAARGIAVNPFIWNDPIQIYLNPAYGNMYRDYIWLNAGGGGLTGTTTNNDGYGLQHGGVNFSLGDKISVGSILSYDPTVTNQVAGALAPGGVGINSGLTLAPVEVLQFMGTFAFGQSSSLGLRVLYGWSANDNIASGTGTTPMEGTNEFTASVIGLVAGIYFDMGSGSALEGSVAFASSSAEDALGQSATPVTGEANATEIGLNARGKLRINNKVNFIPAIGFGTASGDGTNGGTAATTVDISGTTLYIGAGADLTVGDFYLAGGVTYFMGDMETTTTPTGGMGTTTSSNTSGFPVIQIGGEWAFTDWLTGRLPVTIVDSIRFLPRNPSGTGTIEMNPFGGLSNVAVGGYAADNLVVLGLAGEFGNAGIEATVSESALRRGFGLIGSTDNINSFGYVTLNYNID